MSISKLITLAAILSTMAISSYKLPAILHKINLAKLYLIQGSQASKWCRPFMLLNVK